MAEIKLNIPDAYIGRVVNGIADKYRYDIKKKEGETKGAFSKRMLVEQFIIPSVKDAENTAAYISSKASTDSEIDSKIVIT